MVSYGRLNFYNGIHGREIAIRGWNLDFEGKTMKGITEIILEVTKALLEDQKVIKTMTDCIIQPITKKEPE